MKFVAREAKRQTKIAILLGPAKLPYADTFYLHGQE
jgi:hypothetical protein